MEDPVMLSSIPNTLLWSRHSWRCSRTIVADCSLGSTLVDNQMPTVIVVIVVLDIHNPVSHLIEACTLQWLREVVSGHLIGWTVLNGELILLDSVSDEKVSHIEMTGPLSC